jgi:hypothetical protein
MNYIRNDFNLFFSRFIYELHEKVSFGSEFIYKIGGNWADFGDFEEILKRFGSILMRF